MPLLLKTAVLLSILWLFGCESLPTTHHTLYTPLELKQKLPSLRYWQAEGKIAFKMGSERQKASFDWSQHNRNYNIHIFGPLGVGSTWLKRSSRQVTLESSRIGSHKAKTPEALMEALMGWQVPVSNMQYWVKGQLAPNIPLDAPMDFNEQQLPKVIYQDGWTVTISQYQTTGRWTLPRKIIATRGDLRLMTVVKRWQPKTSGVWF